MSKLEEMLSNIADLAFRDKINAVEKYKLKDIFFVTGSCAYGPQTTSSDLDLVVSKEDGAAIKEQLKGLGIEITERADNPEYRGFYFNFIGIKINIVIPFSGDKHDKGAWLYATTKMKQIPPILNRTYRKQMFRSFADEYNGDCEVNGVGFFCYNCEKTTSLKIFPVMEEK